MCITSIIFFWLIVTIYLQLIYLRPKTIPMQLRLHALKCVHDDNFPYFAISKHATRYYSVLPDCFLFIMNSVDLSHATAAHNEFFVAYVYDTWKGLALTLFMLWVFTNNHNVSFSFNDFAFFANRFNWWSYFHSKSSFLYKAPFFTGCDPFSGYFSKSVRITLYMHTSQKSIKNLQYFQALFISPDNSSLC